MYKGLLNECMLYIKWASDVIYIFYAERGFSWAQGLVDEVTNPTWLRNELDKGVRGVYDGEDVPQEVS